MKQKQERSWFVVKAKKLVEYGKILLNLVFKRKLGKLLNLVTQFHFCIGRVGISTLVKFVLVFYWRVQRLLKEMQGQVTFLNQNGLIPFGIANPKSKRQKHNVLTEKFSLFFSKNCVYKALLLITQEEICVQIYADRQVERNKKNRQIGSCTGFTGLTRTEGFSGLRSVDWLTLVRVNATRNLVAINIRAYAGWARGT